jgi:hypothetical protein
LRGQATHEHFSIEASVIVTLVRTTVSSSKFLTRINALSLFGCEERALGAAQWFAEHYPMTKSYTVNTHMEGLSGNNSVQKHQPRRTALRRNPATYKFSALP